MNTVPVIKQGGVLSVQPRTEVERIETIGMGFTGFSYRCLHVPTNHVSLHSVFVVSHRDFMKLLEYWNSADWKYWE